MAGSTIYKGTYGRQLSPQMQTVPATATALTTTNTLLYSIYVNNLTGSDATITMSDGQTPAQSILPTSVIPANTSVFFEWNDGLFCPGGLTWEAGTADALNAAVTASYKETS